MVQGILKIFVILQNIEYKVLYIFRMQRFSIRQILLEIQAKIRLHLATGWRHSQCCQLAKLFLGLSQKLFVGGKKFYIKIVQNITLYIFSYSVFMQFLQ